MDEFHGRVSARVNAAPQAVFDFITDVDRLPEWNAAIEAVLELSPWHHYHLWSRESMCWQ
jgi:uncharacterized protein YndB with AHSA1/START domain